MKVLSLFLLFFSLSKTYSSPHLDRLAQDFDLMKMEKISPYDFGVSAVKYWDIEKERGEISKDKYCLEVNGIRKVVAFESRQSPQLRQKSITLFNYYLDKVKNFDQYCELKKFK